MKLTIFLLLTFSALVLETKAAGAYDYGSGAGIDPINRKLGFDRGIIYFSVFLLGLLVLLLFIGACIAFVCLYKIHHKRAMQQMWRTKPGTRRLVDSPEKEIPEASEANPPPYQPTHVELPPTYSNNPQNTV